MRASRLLTILIVLQARGRVSAEALARELEVSVRTIYRDVDQLGAAGVPVYAERGRNGGFALLGGFRTNLTGLTAPEADAVSLIGMAQAAADLGLGEDAESARLKILASIPPGKGKLAQRVATRFHLDPAPWYERPAPPTVLRTLAEAVWSDRQVRISYESWKGLVKRLISPLGLVMKGGTWYAAGAAAGTTRIYRVAGMRTLEITDEANARPRNFDLAKFWVAAARDFEAGLRSEMARVRLSPRGVQLLRDVNPAGADAVAAQHPSPPANEWIEATIPFERLPHAVREALRMGADMEVIAPAELRAAIAKEAAKLQQMHAGVARGKAIR
ncbi:MAG TPA: WYL domain-containing protein [Steroidobacteraceae bacterium]|nr:WYL domain-containing protein [Steroidobacteraceae bacterium]